VEGAEIGCRSATLRAPPSLLADSRPSRNSWTGPPAPLRCAPPAHLGPAHTFHSPGDESSVCLGGRRREQPQAERDQARQRRQRCLPSNEVGLPGFLHYDGRTRSLPRRQALGWSSNLISSSASAATANAATARAGGRSPRIAERGESAAVSAGRAGANLTPPGVRRRRTQNGAAGAGRGAGRSRKLWWPGRRKRSNERSS
jgi:hypothetical protein